MKAIRSRSFDFASIARTSSIVSALDTVPPIVGRWLAANPSRRVVIVDPYRDRVPPSLTPWSDQVECRKLAATSFLDEEDGISRSARDSLELRMTRCIRRAGNEQGARLLAEANKVFTNERVERLAKLISERGDSLELEDPASVLAGLGVTVDDGLAFVVDYMESHGAR